MNCWEQIKQTLATKLNGAAFDNWLSKTSFLRAADRAVWVAVPDESTRQYIEQEYGPDIWDSIRQLNLPIDRVYYQLSSSQPESNPATHNSDVVFSPSTNLNPKFTFDSFVVGSCNQFAHAAARAVATAPSKTYNPLFIYGGAGIGKTHLMHAIGRSLLDSYAGLKIVVTTSERFMNEMINCIKLDRMPTFHRHYRSADVLLIDDIQVISGKERTQEEFFHTFNALFEHQKQIVISSDTPPKNISGLVERLRSRFESGLLVDVQPPDLETKMAILDKKAELAGVRLPDDVRVFVADRTKHNVRELEGALINLIACSSVTGSPITLDMAHQVLKHLNQTPDRKISIESVIKAVADYYGLLPAQIKAKTNQHRIAVPRQIAMYIAKDATGASYPELGRAFGGKHHTTVLHSVQKIDELRQRDGDLNRVILKITDSFH